MELSHNGKRLRLIALADGEPFVLGRAAVPETPSSISKRQCVVERSGQSLKLTSQGTNATLYTLAADGTQRQLGNGASRLLHAGDSFSLSTQEPELCRVQFALQEKGGAAARPAVGAATPESPAKRPKKSRAAVDYLKFQQPQHGGMPKDVLTPAQVMTAASGHVPVPGLFVYEDAIDPDLEARLFHDSSLFDPANLPSGEPGSVRNLLASRKHQVSGSVDAVASSIHQVVDNERLIDTGRGNARQNPPELVERVEWIRRQAGMESVIMFPDDTLAFTYYVNSGKGIPSHVDSYWRWGLTVIGVSLGGPATLVMTHDDDGRVIKVALPRRSMYIFSGEARNFWKHSIWNVGWGAGADAQPRRSITMRCSRTWEHTELVRKIAAAPDTSTRKALQKSLVLHRPDVPELLERKWHPGRQHLMYWRTAPAKDGLSKGQGWRFTEEELAVKRTDAIELRQWLDNNWPGGAERW